MWGLLFVLAFPALGADVRSQRPLQKPLLASQLVGSRAARHSDLQRRQILQLEVRAKACMAPGDTADVRINYRSSDVRMTSALSFRVAFDSRAFALLRAQGSLAEAGPCGFGGGGDSMFVFVNRTALAASWRHLTCATFIEIGAVPAVLDGALQLRLQATGAFHGESPVAVIPSALVRGAQYTYDASVPAILHTGGSFDCARATTSSVRAPAEQVVTLADARHVVAQLLDPTLFLRLHSYRQRDMYGDAHAALQALRRVLTTRRLSGKATLYVTEQIGRVEDAVRRASPPQQCAALAAPCTVLRRSVGESWPLFGLSSQRGNCCNEGTSPGMVRCGMLKQTCVRLGMYNTCADIGRCVRIQALTSSTHARNATTAPLHSPTTAPTHSPTTAPTHSPTTVPTRSPTAAPRPTPQPTPAAPTPRPTLTPTPYPTPRILWKHKWTFNKTSGYCPPGTWGRQPGLESGLARLSRRRRGGIGSWVRINFEQVYRTPIVIAGIPSHRTAGTVIGTMIASVRGVNTTGFWLRLHETPCNSSDKMDTRAGRQTHESVAWLVAESGTHTIGGRKIVAGLHTGVHGQSWTTVSFEHGGFTDGSNPAILSQIQNARLEDYFVNLRHRRTDHDSFQVRAHGMQNGKPKGFEVVGYVAIETGRGRGAGGLNFVADVTGATVSHATRFVALDHDFKRGQYGLFGSLHSSRSFDAASLRYRRKQGHRFSVFIDEDTCVGTATRQTSEKIAYLAVGVGVLEVVGSGSAFCTACAPGRFQSHRGRDRCYSCAAGTTTHGWGAEKCVNTMSPTPHPTLHPTQYPTPWPTPPPSPPTPSPTPSSWCSASVPHVAHAHIVNGDAPAHAFGLASHEGRGYDRNHRVGAKFRYECERGFILVGPHSVVCEHAGDWSPGPICVRSTQQCSAAPEVSHAMHVEFGRHIGAAVKYLCRPGYEMVGIDTVTCSAARQWTNTPSCRRLQPVLHNVTSKTVAQQAQGPFEPNNCVLGKYSSLQIKGNIVRRLCVTCSKGRYGRVRRQGDAAMGECVDCKASDRLQRPNCKEARTTGAWHGSATAKPFPCSIGHAIENVGKSRTCVSCEPGYYGTIVDGHTMRCRRCPPGKFQFGYASDSCDMCTPGRFQPLRGQSSCTDCAPGTHQSRPGGKVCYAPKRCSHVRCVLQLRVVNGIEHMRVKTGHHGSERRGIKHICKAERGLVGRCECLCY